MRITKTKIKPIIIGVVIASLILVPQFAFGASFTVTSNAASHATVYVQKGKSASVYSRNLVAGDKVSAYKSSKISVATVSGKGLVKGKAVGTATITITTKKGKKDTIKIKVVKSAKKAKKITLPKTKTANVKQSFRLTASVSPPSATETVKWSSSNKKVATVGKDGYVKTLRAGKATISAKTASGKKASCTLTVKDPVKISATSISVRADRNVTLTASAPSGAIKWSSSDNAVATVSQKGVVTPKKGGTAVITATTVANKTSASCKVKVTSHVRSTGVTVSPTTRTLLAGNSVKLTAKLQSADPNSPSNDDITWSSSNAAVASVDKAGNVKGLAYGTTDITVKAESGASATAVIKVQTIAPKKEKVQLTPGVQYVVQNNTYGLGDSPKFTYSTSNKNIATVSSTGLVSVNQRDKAGKVKTGTVNITTKTAGGDTAVTKITVVDMPTVVDISKFQGDINWDKAAGSIDFAIMRVTYGTHASDYEPKYASYSLAAQTRGVPYGGYCYGTYKTKAEAENQATIFYNAATAGERGPILFVVDCEESYITRGNTEAFIAKLRSLAGYRVKVGVYAAHHLYTKMNLNLTTDINNPKTPDFIWVPRYSLSNDGTITDVPAPTHLTDMWQFSSGGRIPGISGKVDMNTLYYADGSKISKKDHFNLEWLSTPAEKPAE